MRLAKKLMPAFDDIEGAILLVNAIDPQLATIAIFLEAIAEIPHFIVLNKVDAVPATRAQEITEHLHSELVIWASTMEKRGINGIKRELAKLPEGKIAVLGIFNSGKTSLINELTGEYDTVSDLPGTTLEVKPREYQKQILLDTVGQVIDVNRPLMISVDYTGCETLEDKVRKTLTEDKEAIIKSTPIAIPKILEAISLIKNQIEEGHKLIITGAGASALVAMEMAGQAQETGIPVMVFTNNFATCSPVSFAKGLGEDELAVAEYGALAVSKGDVVIGISASGGTACVHDFLRSAKKKGAYTIAITENSDTPLGHTSDIIIKSEAKPEGPSSSKIQIAHLAIGHALILALADDRGVDAAKSIEFMMPKRMPSKKMGLK